MSVPLAFLFGNMEGVDLIVVVVIGILLFGKRLPEIGRNLGKTIVEFKKGLSSSQEEIHTAIHEEDAKPAPRLPTANTRQIKQIASTGDEP